MSDGIRKNVAELTSEERDEFIQAIQQLDASKAYPDGVSYWDKQDQIHQATHVHGGPSFLTWHRELCNRFEELLREVDPDVSLHYWDWTTDPRNSSDGEGGTVNLFSDDFMGSASGRAGGPLDGLDNEGELTGSREETGDPADPPREITRDVDPGAPSVGSDQDIITAGDGLNQQDQFEEFRETLEGHHNYIHGYIGGTIGSAHSSFEDPFVFLLHSNVDRLFAMWQTASGKSWRLDPELVYGKEGSSVSITENLEPWAGGSGLRPWAPPENQVEIKNSKHQTVVQPPCYDTLPLEVDLAKPAIGAPLSFQAVPEGETTVRAIVFSVKSCLPLHFDVVDGTNVEVPALGTTGEFGLIQSMPTEVHPTTSLTTEERILISFTGTTPGSGTTGSVTVRCEETEDEWVVSIDATTVERPKTAVVMVLDKSGSMGFDSGVHNDAGAMLDRMDVLQSNAGAKPLPMMLLEDDGIGAVAFNHMPMKLMDVELAGGFSGIGGRWDASQEIDDLSPGGNTAIGSGVTMAQELLNNAPDIYQEKAIIVLTDGMDYPVDTLGTLAISEELSDRVFAIGLGTPENLDTEALDTLVNGTGGSFLMTGDLTPELRYLVAKYYLQILAGVKNTAIIVDPAGQIKPGQQHRHSFTLSEEDIDVDVVLFAPTPNVVDFQLETPDGDVIEASDLHLISGATQITGNDVMYYRMHLPIVLDERETHAGEWHALITLEEDNKAYRRYLDELLETNQEGRFFVDSHGIGYNLSVHARSNVRMDATLRQDGTTPGSTFILRVVLTESGMPLEDRSDVTAEVARPDGTNLTLQLREDAAGVFEERFEATATGVYRVRVLADGVTRQGQRFTREQLATGGVSTGRPSRPRDERERGADEQLCELLLCMTEDGLEEYLEEIGVDVDAVRECLEAYCGDRWAVRDGTNRERSITDSELEVALRDPDVRDAISLISSATRRRR